MRRSDLLASVGRVFRALLVALGYQPPLGFTDEAVNAAWQPWLQSFADRLSTGEGTLSAAQVALDARDSFVSKMPLLDREDSLNDARFVPVFEACVRHVFQLADTDTKPDQAELHALEKGWLSWVKKKATKVQT